MVRVNSTPTVLFWHSFDNKSKHVYLCGGDTEMKLSNGKDYLFFKIGR